MGRSPRVSTGGSWGSVGGAASPGGRAAPSLPDLPAAKDAARPGAGGPRAPDVFWKTKPPLISSAVMALSEGPCPLQPAPAACYTGTRAAPTPAQTPAASS